MQEPNLTVSANVGLNVYGMRPVNITIDFCKALGNVLCPLPQYNFSGERLRFTQNYTLISLLQGLVLYHCPRL